MRVPIDIAENTSKTHVSPDMPAEALAASGDPAAAQRDVPDQVHGGADLDDAVDPAGRGRHVGFGVPDTLPTGEPVASLEGDPWAAERGDAGGDAPTVPAPSAVARPIPGPAGVPPTMPGLRDRPVSTLPISTAPQSLPPPKESQRTSGPSPACPQCESPMAWVEEHLRFYCKSCRMYF